MQVAVRGKNVEVTQAIREYLEKKVGKLEKFVDHEVNAQVNMYVERGRHIVEVTADMNGVLLRGEERTGDMYASIDLVAEKLEKQLLKYKARFKKRGRENGLSELVEAEVPVLPEEGLLVKTKRFNAKPVSVEEAIMRMDLLSHDFFVFTNADTDRVSVVYRRRDGNYGLLEPEM